MSIYLTDAEMAALIRETSGAAGRSRKNSAGGPATVPFALGTGRLLPWKDGSYDWWTLLVLAELRGIELSETERNELARWRAGENIGTSR